MKIRQMLIKADEFIRKWFPIALLATIIGVIPLILYMRVVEFDSLFQQLYGRTDRADFFSYYKYLWLLIVTSCALLWAIFNTKVVSSWYHRPLIVFSFFTIISTIFAKHRQIAVFGAPTRHEGLLTWLAYMSVVFVFVQLIRSKTEAKVILAVLVTSSAIAGFLGLLHITGHNPMYTSFTRNFLIPDMYSKVADSYTWATSYDPATPAFMTFGNSNFAGSYLTMLVPLSLAFLIALQSRYKYLLLPINLLLYLALMACKSRAGFFACIFSIMLMLPFLRTKLRKNWRLALFMAFAYLMTPFVLDILTISKEGSFLSTSFMRPAITQKSIFGNFHDVELDNHQAKVVFDGVALSIQYNDDDTVQFFDSSSESLPYRLMNMNPREGEEAIVASHSILPQTVSNEATFVDHDFSYISQHLEETQPDAGQSVPFIEVDNQIREKRHPGDKFLVLFPEKILRGYIVIVWPQFKLFQISRGGGSIFLRLTNSGFKMLDQHFNVAHLREIETIGFTNMEQFASRRGYIWQRTLPLLKKALLIGYGPDTFPAHFPNDDLIGKLKHWGSIGLMIEKPHNLYLQIFYNSGLIALLAILILFAGYALDCVKLYLLRPTEDFMHVAGVGIFVAITGYLAAGMFNDSVVSVAPVFWALLGLGIAVNRLNSTNPPLATESIPDRANN